MNLCFEADSSNSQHLQKDFVCSGAVRQKPRDSRSSFSPLQACCPEGFQKLGNTVSVPYNDFQPLIQIAKPTEAAPQAPFPARPIQQGQPCSPLSASSPSAQSTPDREQPGCQPQARYHLRGVPSQTSCFL